MMNEWREAVRLAMFEWKASWRGLFRNFLYCGLLFMLFKLLLDGGSASFATLSTVLLFGLTASLSNIGQTKLFRPQRINSGTYADPQIFMLRTLAVPRGVIVKRQYVLVLLRSLPWLVSMFVLLYFATPDRHLVIPAAAFIAFACMWISLGLTAGGLDLVFSIQPILFRWLGYILIIPFILVMSSLFVLTESNTGQKILYWPIHAAEFYPLVTIIISFATATASSVLWQALLKRRLERIDLL